MKQAPNKAETHSEVDDPVYQDYKCIKSCCMIHIRVTYCDICVTFKSICSFCMHNFLLACVGWCNAEACCVPTIPSFSFFAASSKEAELLCVCQPSSPGPIVKLCKPVCSGSELTYSEEYKPKEREGGGEEKWELIEENSFGRRRKWGRVGGGGVGQSSQEDKRKSDRGKGKDERNFIVLLYKLQWLTLSPPLPFLN